MILPMLKSMILLTKRQIPQNYKKKLKLSLLARDLIVIPDPIVFY